MCGNILVRSQVHRARSAKIMHRTEERGSRAGTRRFDALHRAVSAGCSSYALARRSVALYGASAKGTPRRFRFSSVLSRVSKASERSSYQSIISQEALNGPDNLRTMIVLIFLQLLSFSKLACEAPIYGKIPTKHISQIRGVSVRTWILQFDLAIGT